MMNQKSTKRALLASVMALLLCFSMLFGTTFAWFSDTITSVNNNIVAGNLDVELYWSTDAENWETVAEDTNLFTDTPWEPGHAEVVYLKVVNEGDLALKYQLGANIVSETIGTNKAGNKFKLSNYIKFGVVETDTAFVDRQAAVAAVENAKIISAGFSQSKELLSQAEDYVALVLYMPKTVGNEANYKTGTATPEIKLGINLIATQYTHEKDGYDDQYDADALACDIIATPETIGDILATVEEGAVIGLGAGTYNTIKVTQNNLTFVAVKSAVVGFMDMDAHSGIVIDGLNFDASLARPTYTCKYSPALSGFVANITGSATVNPAHDITIKNCTFTGEATDVNVYAPIDFEEGGRTSGHAYNITITGNTFECDAINYIRLNYLTVGDTFITHNTFGGAAYSTTHNTINVTGNSSNMTIIGNTFYNWNVANAAFGSSYLDGYVQLVINDNEFINLANANEFNALDIKTSYTDANSALTYNGNVGNYGKATLATKPVTTDDGKDNLYKMTVNTAIDVGDVISNAEPGETVVLGDVDYAQNNVPAVMDIEGYVSDVVIDASGSEHIQFNVKAGAALENVTFKNLRMEDFVGITGNLGGGVNIENGAQADITFENCYFSPSATNYAGVRSYSTDVELTFVECTFDGCNYAFYTAGNCIDSLVYENCTFDNFSSWVVQSQTTTKDVYFSMTGCTIKNCHEGMVKIAGTPTGGTFVFANNTLTNCAGHDGSDAKWFTVNLSNFDSVNIDVSGNTLDNNPWNIEVNDGQGLTK